MTPRQLQALDFITEYHAMHRVGPTLQEIADHLGLSSKSGAHRIVEALLYASRLRRTGDRNRGFEPMGTLTMAAATTAQLRAEIARREKLHG
jgi:SOS-response transcriptional repressor LexA